MYYIYRITNNLNGKTYIGQHKYKKLNDSYMGGGKHLKAAQKKYGIENFKKDILVFNISKKEHIDILEKTFIAAEREKVGVENCYNISDGGEGFSGQFSEEHKKHLSEAKKGKPSPKKGKPGKPRSEETRQKISETLKGRGHPHSEETKKRLSEVGKGKHNSKGKPRSKEAKKKMSEAKKGKHWKLVDGKRVWY